MNMHNRQTDDENEAVTDDEKRRARLVETTCKIQL